ncbi:MAG TPA: hypothetical protein DCY54_02700 [Parachlamydiales bacterium]|nr:hypothetical protein [Parachlamydiales bacterium]HKZ45094.1 DUF2971 domain-containing protein [archaeon]
MFEEHAQFICPSEDTVLWRYLDFTKFASLLEKKSLYFCRTDLLGDPFEGSYPKGSLAAREQHFQEMGYKDNCLRTLRAISRNSRRQMYVSCWHMNPIESEAMWNRYTSNGRTNEGIAIRTTFKKLRDSFNVTEKRIFIGQVRYIDYPKTIWMGSMRNLDTGEDCPAPAYGGGFYSVLHKRNSFDYERELRCLFWQPHIRNSQIDLSAQDICEGHFIAVDLEVLVDGIYIAPNAGMWFKELTESTIKNNGHSFEVFQSTLAEEPVF